MSIETKEGRPDQSFDWTLWLKWILVTTLGWGAGLAVGIEFLIGLFVGLLQWLVLRTLIEAAGWWILSSAVGWAGAVVLVPFVLQVESEGNLLAGLGPAIIGMGIGLGQWLLLRWQVYRAWWWIVLSALGWAVGLMGVLGVSLGGAVAGGVTGLGLELLLRHRRSGQREEDPSRDACE